MSPTTHTPPADRRALLRALAVLGGAAGLSTAALSAGTTKAVQAVTPGSGALERSFQAAVGSFRSGRHSEAFGRLLSLAYEGDADAARIVLFMHQYGPTLFGSFWDLATHDVASFEEMAASTRARKPPAFKPLEHPVKTRAAR